MENKSRELVQDLDDSFAGILGSLGSIKSIKTELGQIREDVDNTDRLDLTSMALQFRDMYHKIILIDDLMTYVSKELKGNFNKGYDIKNELFERIVHGQENER